MYEDELIPMFEGFGQIFDFRLMIDPVSGLNKGYGFCTYATKESAQKAVKEMDKKEVRGGKKLGICLSLPNDRLFVGSIPKSKTKQQIMDEFSNVTEGLIDVIVYISPEDKKKNRGFAFLQYESHKAASLARRRLMSGKIRVFGNITPTVDWADPQEEPDDEVMQTVRHCSLLTFQIQIVFSQVLMRCMQLLDVWHEAHNHAFFISISMFVSLMKLYHNFPTTFVDIPG